MLLGKDTPGRDSRPGVVHNGSHLGPAFPVLRACRAVQEMNQATPGRTLTQHRKAAVNFRDTALLRAFQASLMALQVGWMLGMLVEPGSCSHVCMVVTRVVGSLTVGSLTVPALAMVCSQEMASRRADEKLRSEVRLGGRASCAKGVH